MEMASSRYRSITIQIKINHHSLEGYGHFVHRQGTTGMGRGRGGISLYSRKISVYIMFISSLSRICPSLAGLPLVALAVRGGGVTVEL